MLLPTTLPTAMSVAPLTTAPTETATSGELVPTETIVRPTTSGVIPSDSAIFEAPRTSDSAPSASAPSPRTKKRRWVSMICAPTIASGGLNKNYRTVAGNGVAPLG